MNIDYFEDEREPEHEPATLERLTMLAFGAKELEAEIDRGKVLLAEMQNKYDKIMRVTIPEIMETLGVAEYKLIDGSVVSFKAEVKCGITEEHKPAAWAWLEEHEFDGIIKTEVHSSFGKGEMESAKAAVKVLLEEGYDARIFREVHPQTLKAFVRERLEAGDKIPTDTFGIFEFKQAKIKLPKTRN